MSVDPKVLRVDGAVVEALPGLLFRVKINVSGSEREVLGHLAGKLKINHIRIIPGDKVIIELPSLNDRRGRIVRRL